jgi:mono/diheme cytochrome c family protein
MKRFAIAAACLAALSLAARADDGADLFKTKCAACHGKDAKGGAIFKGAIAGKDEATVKKMITEGGGKMKPVKTLDDGQASSVAKYVSGLK